MNETNQDTRMMRRPVNTYYHASPRGNGSACMFDLQPARADKEGSVFLEIAMQISGGANDGVAQAFARFDWENKVVVKLDRHDLSEMLMVLRGMQESICNGKGLFHRSAKGNTVIRFQHQMEPRLGYHLSVSRKSPTDGDVKNHWFFFDIGEAFSLMLVLEQAMMYVCFGLPSAFGLQGARLPQYPVKSEMQYPVKSEMQYPPQTMSQRAEPAEAVAMVSGDPSFGEQ